MNSNSSHPLHSLGNHNTLILALEILWENELRRKKESTPHKAYRILEGEGGDRKEKKHVHILVC